MRRALLSLIISAISLSSYGQLSEKAWVDSVFRSLTPDQRIAQLFMVAAYSNLKEKHVREIRELITNYNIGGLIWMQGGPVRQGKLANYYQSVAQTPLIYSIDGEWGLAMRLDSTPRYPKSMTLGAIQDDSLLYRLGRQMGRDCRRMGIHINFAPVADVNNNPLNPVIGMRSFGEEKNNVARKAVMVMAGMQDEHVMANGKHFPGHGDTESDSHLTLPLISQPAQRLDSLELYPFRKLFERGLGSIMVAHLSIPAYDTTRNLPSTLSKRVVTDLLKTEMGFKGLVFTDALSMKGVTKFFPEGEVEVRALQAGNDVMLFSGNVPKAIAAINKALENGALNRDDLDDKCRRVLTAKYWCGLRGKASVVTRNIWKDLNGPDPATLNRKLAAAAVTLLQNKQHTLPLTGLDSLRVLNITFGDTLDNSLFNALKSYCYIEQRSLPHQFRASASTAMLQAAARADYLVIQVNRSTIRPDNYYGVGPNTVRLIDSLARSKPVVLALMCNPYVVNAFSDMSPYRAVILGYENMPELSEAAAAVITGGAQAQGKLPVTTKHYARSTGLSIDVMKPYELAAEKDKFRNKKFAAVDSLAISGIIEHAYPGCQVVALKDGQMIYQKSFGHYTYNGDSREVSNVSQYDLASITKIAASSLALMKLATEGRFDYRKKLVDYLPELKGSNKEDLVIEDVLTHQAGLQAWIPFYLRTINKDGTYKPGIYSAVKTAEYNVQVAKGLYVSNHYADTVFKMIVDSKLEKPGKYLYSDLGYYFMQRIIERITGMPLKDYVHDLFAKAGIGLRFTPLDYFSQIQVVPTEIDLKFRKQLLQGNVHDPGAALLGGVSGHAGLFGNAQDVAYMMQLFLNKGELNGVRLLDSNVVKDFTACHFCPGNRRGLCFEKPEPDLKKDSPVTQECSLESYGHSGFTGTFAWADPKNNLVIVFLSNRVYPSADDNKLVKLGIRGKIHKAFYDALKETP